MNLNEIKQAVQSLSTEDFKTFEAWFDKARAEKWAEDIEADTKAGKLNKLAEKALEDFRNGKFTKS